MTANGIAGRGREWETDLAWRSRLERDRRRAERNQTAPQRRVTETLLARAIELGAEAFALTGSTARNRRTAVSDLDYHVIGPRPQTFDLDEEIDVVVTDATGLLKKLRAGDDYVQWTLRYGCILFDSTGVLREGLRVLVTERLWPDTARKRERLPVHRAHAERLIAMGDRDAAHEQLRAALTAVARAALIDAGVFPLSRGELAGQLSLIGWTSLATALDATIHTAPSLLDLSTHVRALDDAIAVGLRLPSSADQGAEMVVHARGRRARTRVGSAASSRQ